MLENKSNELSAKPISDRYDESIKEYIDSIRETHRSLPILLVMKYKFDKSTDMYLRSIKLKASSVGIEVMEITYDRFLSVNKYLELSNSMSGVLLLTPYPKCIDNLLTKMSIDELIDFGPDVDCLTFMRRGISISYPEEQTAPLAKAISEVLDYYSIDPDKYNNVVVAGRSILSKLIANQLLARDYSVSMIHTKTANYESYLSNCDILIAGDNFFDSLNNTSYITSIPYFIDIGNPTVTNETSNFYYRFLIDNYITHIGLLTTSIMLSNTVENYRTLGLGDPVIRDSDNE